MELKEGLKINNYRDLLENKIVCFELIEGVMDRIIEETAQKNPTFLIKDYDKMVNINDLQI